MDILDAIRKRQTARSFTGDSVDPEILDRILEAGRLAPSAKNRQTWRFIAVCKDKYRRALTDACYGDQRISTASCVIAACTTNIQYTMPNGQPSHPLDLAFAVSFMTLQAVEEGLATAITGTYDEQAVKELLTVPHAMRVVLLLAVGYSTDEANSYTDRLSRDRIISFDHW